MSSLTVSQRHQLEQLESTVERHLQAFWEVGEALIKIRDLQLYKGEYRTFDEYCEARWGFRKSRIHQMIGSTHVIRNLSQTTVDLPANERQARPLMALPPEQQPQAWQTARKLADSPTHEHVERAVKAVKSQRESPISAGQVLVVHAPKSPHAGQSARVIDVDGLIVTAELSTGERVPFLANELTPAKDQSWTEQKTKADRLESLEALLIAEQERVRVLESALSRLLSAVKSGSVSQGLVREVEGLA